MKRRLLILTEIIAPYRIPVFNALAKRNDIDVHVVFLSETDALLRQWRVYREEIDFSYEVLKSFRPRIGAIRLLINDGLTAALNRSRPDVILAGGYNYPATWQALRWARSRHIPFLLWSESNLQDSRKHLWPVEFAKRKFIQSCQGFVVPGISATKYLGSFGVSRELLFAAPNAIDVERFSRLAAEARGDSLRRQRLGLPERYFLYVGRLVKSKGIFDLLSAYATLPDAARQIAGLVFVGDGQERAELIQRSRQIRGQVLFPGFVQRDELPAFYVGADALIFPTHSDTWGFVVNEAMACGVPVISSNVAGCAADLVHDGVNGYIVSAGHPQDLARAMLQVLSSSSELRQKMAYASLELGQSFTPQIWAEGVVRAALSTGVVRE